MTWPTTSRQSRGYGASWDKVRAAVLKRDSHLCQPCMRTNRLSAATQVDHVKPKSQGGTDVMRNLQAICPDCHKAKTFAETGRQRRTDAIREDGESVDGW